jgi:CheY-like chemotaxis protein
MAETMLKRKMGCEVVSACNGYQALEIFRERKEEIGLVLLDLSMPGMDGWATLSALRTLRSDAPVILTSGYDESQVMGGDHPERPQGFLQKPYQSKEFQMAIKAALRGPMMRTE